MGNYDGILKVAAKKLGLTPEQYKANRDQGLKSCIKCRSWKPTHMFGKDRTRYDGLKSRCKECVRVKARRCRKGEQAGDRNPNWKNGKTPLLHRARSIPEYTEWRLAVFERDKYTCQHCGDNRGRNLNAHHIKDFANHPAQRYDVANGITLCKPCHTKLHTEHPRIRQH